MGCSQPSRLTPERAPRPEEVGDVGVHYPAIACLQLPPDAPHGHVRRASRPKTKVLVSERRLKDRFQNLDHCLLTHPVHYGGYAERAFGRRAWLVDLDPSHGPWPITAIFELLVQQAEVVFPLSSNRVTVTPSTPPAPLFFLTRSHA